MTNSTIPVSAKCSCGEPITLSESVTDQTLLICKRCGSDLGTYGELKSQAAATVASKIESIFNGSS